MNEHKEPTHVEWAERFAKVCGIHWRDVYWNGSTNSWMLKDNDAFQWKENPNPTFENPADIIRECIMEGLG